MLTSLGSHCLQVCQNSGIQVSMLRVKPCQCQTASLGDKGCKPSVWVTVFTEFSTVTIQWGKIGQTLSGTFALTIVFSLSTIFTLFSTPPQP